MSTKQYRPSYKSTEMLGKCVMEDEKKKFKIDHPELLSQFLNLHSRVGDTISIKFTSKRPKRSVLQNNYYWLYLDLISGSSGHTAEELHGWAKGKFLTTGISEVFGEKTRKVDSTTSLTIGEFCEYIMRIEKETNIPSPETEPFLKALSHSEYDKLKAEQKVAYDKMKSKIVIN